jgi:hypothetical protein
VILALFAPAFANGQTSHQWITERSLEELPAGELKDFLSAPDVHDALLNGTMFPDGGYAVGDNYGEMAHWEPTQDLYLAWILANHPAPFDEVGAQHAAFLFGMMSHGMADQFYDATFMERSKAWDPAESWACCSMDEATDVAMAAATEPGVVPEKWWPEELIPLFAANGHTVDFDTVDQGQSLLGLAIAYVGASSEYEETVQRYTDEFPWACTHQVDPDVVGNPQHEARIVAAYWQVLWARLHGEDGWSSPVIGSVPDAGGWQPVVDHTSVDGRIAVVFAKGLEPSTVDGAITVARADGTEVPVTVDVYYGYASHVVNITPGEDWAVDAEHVITVHPGVTTFDGYVLEDTITIPFTTKEPVEAEPEPMPMPEGDGCGCGGAAGAGWMWLVAGVGVIGRRPRGGRGASRARSYRSWEREG